MLTNERAQSILRARAHARPQGASCIGKETRYYDFAGEIDGYPVRFDAAGGVVSDHPSLGEMVREAEAQVRAEFETECARYDVVASGYDDRPPNVEWAGLSTWSGPDAPRLYVYLVPRGCGMDAEQLRMAARGSRRVRISPYAAPTRCTDIAVRLLRQLLPEAEFVRC